MFLVKCEVGWIWHWQEYWWNTLTTVETVQYLIVFQWRPNQEVVWSHCGCLATAAGLITGPGWWRRTGRMPLGWNAVSLAPGGDEWIVVRNLCFQLPFENQRSWSFILYGWAFFGTCVFYSELLLQSYNLKQKVFLTKFYSYCIFLMFKLCCQFSSVLS